MRIVKCQMCWIDMEVKFWVKKYCNACRQKRDDELQKIKDEKQRLKTRMKK